jgi:hypothetical protein
VTANASRKSEPGKHFSIPSESTNLFSHFGNHHGGFSKKKKKKKKKRDSISLKPQLHFSGHILKVCSFLPQEQLPNYFHSRCSKIEHYNFAGKMEGTRKIPY